MLLCSGQQKYLLRGCVSSKEAKTKSLGEKQSGIWGFTQKASCRKRTHPACCQALSSLCRWYWQLTKCKELEGSDLSGQGSKGGSSLFLYPVFIYSISGSGGPLHLCGFSQLLVLLTNDSRDLSKPRVSPSHRPALCQFWVLIIEPCSITCSLTTQLHTNQHVMVPVFVVSISVTSIPASVDALSVK